MQPLDSRINLWGSMNIGYKDDPKEEIQSISIIPGQSMGNLKLGMNRHDLLNALKIYLTPLEDDTEFLSGIGLRVGYENDRVVLLESDGSWPLFLDDFNIFEYSFFDSIDLIKKKDPEAVVEGDFVTSKKLGIGIMTNQSYDKPPYLVAIFPPEND